MKNIYIISLGGSLVATKDGIAGKFLKSFRRLILEEIKKGKRFFIIVGGGVTARNYIAAAAKAAKVASNNKDWLGIQATRLNALLLKIIFSRAVYPQIIKNPTQRVITKKKIIIGGGWKPGWSTDYVATVIAQKYGVKKLINLSNIDGVYNKDPQKDKSAKMIKRINWQDFRKLVGGKWRPGLNAPFDPLASLKAENLGIEVVIINGRSLKNLKNYLGGKNYKGTLIK